MQNQVGMPWKQWIIQSIPKPTAEQELSHQQFWLRILALYRGHTTMALFFGQFIHLFLMKLLYHILIFYRLIKIFTIPVVECGIGTL